jgi:hypothetical protein
MQQPPEEESQPTPDNMHVEVRSPSHKEDVVLSDRHSETKQKCAMRARLDSLNTDLRYSGFDELRLCLCDSTAVNSLSDV